MYFRTRAARACIAHFPEVVVLAAVDDMVGGDMLCPELCSLVVAWNIFFRRTLEHRYVEIVRVEMQHFNEIFPCHIDGTLLEIVAERPVAEHLEHRVMICVMTNFLQVVVLAAHAQTFL